MHNRIVSSRIVPGGDDRQGNKARAGELDACFGCRRNKECHPARKVEMTPPWAADTTTAHGITAGRIIGFGQSRPYPRGSSIAASVSRSKSTMGCRAGKRGQHLIERRRRKGAAAVRGDSHAHQHQIGFAAQHGTGPPLSSSPSTDRPFKVLPSMSVSPAPPTYEPVDQCRSMPPGTI